jgi:hypothetical protein
LRKLLVSSFVSLDGVVESPMTWAPRFFDDECREYFHRKLDDVEFFLLGRKVYEAFVPARPLSRETHTSTASIGLRSGGHAGAKRMQMFIAKYCQAESDRRELGIRFVALVPSRVMPETDLGQAAVNGYAQYLGVPAEKFLENMGPRQSPTDVAKAVLDIAMKPPAEPGSIFTISAEGVAAAS